MATRSQSEVSLFLRNINMLRRPFEDVVCLVRRRKNDALYDWRIACSGKSTIAPLLARQYQLLHQTGWFRRDDESSKCRPSQPICSLGRIEIQNKSGWEKPEEMVDEEWCFYEEIFPYVNLLDKNQNRPLGGGSRICLTSRSLNVQHLPIYAWLRQLIFKTLYTERHGFYVLEGTNQPWSSFWKTGCNETFFFCSNGS